MISNDSATAGLLSVESGFSSGQIKDGAAGSASLSLVKTGPGLLSLSGTNTYTGATTVSAGTLKFAKRTSLYNAVTTNWTAANLVVKAGGTLAFSVGGTGEFTATDIDVLRVLGTATTGFQTGSFLGLDTTNATGGNFAYNSVIANPSAGANALGLAKLGAGNLTLGGTNTYTGGTRVEAGTLTMGSAGALGTSGMVNIFSGAVVQRSTYAFDLNRLTGAGTLVGTGALTSSANTDQTVGVSLQGGTTLTKSGTGLLALSGTNSYTGVTTVSAGTLEFAKRVSLYNAVTTNWTAANLVVNSGATLAFNVGGTGEFTVADIDALRVLGTATTGFKAGSSLGLDTANAAGGKFVYNSAITNPNAGTNAVGLTKLGAGTLSLGGANSYTGVTKVAGGTLLFAQRNAFYGGTTADWTTAGKFTVGAGATLAFSVGGAGEFTASDLDLVRGIGTATTGFGVGSYLGIDTTNAGGSFIYNSIIANTNLTGTANARGLAKQGTGTLTLGGANTYTGGTRIEGGTLAMGVAQALGATGIVEVSAGALLDTAAFGFDLNRLLGAGVVTGTGAYSYSATGVHTVGVALQGTGATLTVTGGGALVLTGTNTYTGGTTVSAGLLKIGDGGTTGTLSSNVTLASGAGLVFDRSDASVYAGTVSGAGATLAKYGAGMLTLTGTASHTGGTTISGGGLRIGNGGTTGTLVGNVSLSNGADLIFDRSDTVSFGGMISGTGRLTKQGAETLTLSGTNSYTDGTTISAGVILMGAAGAIGTTGTVSIATDATLNTAAYGFDVNRLIGSGTVTGTGAYRYSAEGNKGIELALKGTGATLTKSGAGVLMLTGANTYTGTTMVNDGAVKIGDGGTTGMLAGDVRLFINGAFGRIAYDTRVSGLIFDRSDDFTYNGAITGWGKLTKQGAGTLTLGGANFYSGPTTVSGGTLKLGAATQLSELYQVILTNGGVLDLAGTTQQIASLGINAMGYDGSIAGVYPTGMIYLPVDGEVKNGTLIVVGDTFVKSGRLGATFARSGAPQRWFIGGDESATVLLDGTNDSVNGTDHRQVMIGTAVTGAAGTVKVGNANALAAATEIVQIESGTLDLNGVTGVRAKEIDLLSGEASRLINGKTTAEASFNNAVVLQGIGSGLGGAGDLTLGGVVSGDGGIEKIGAGRLTMTGANTYTGGTTVSEGQIIMGSAAALGTGAIDIDSGATLDAASYGLDLNRLSGSGTATSTGTYTSSAASDMTLATSLAGTASLTKSGSKSLTLSGINTYSGGTRLQSGVLSIGNNQGLGTGDVTINSGTLLIQKGVTVANKMQLAGGSLVRQLAANASLAHAIDASSGSDGTGTKAAILEGALTGLASDTTTLESSFSDTPTTLVTNDEIRMSDVYRFSGTGTDIFVLQLSLTSVTAESILGWLDTNTNQWVNAVTGNTDGAMFFAGNGAYDSITDFHLGYYGVDTTTGSVWAVLNHNSDFSIIPEPSAWILLVLGGLGCFLLRRRSSVF